MPTWVCHRFQPFARNDEGVAAIETALLLTPFLILIVGIIETTLLYFAAISIESAVTDAGRQIRTGVVQSAGDTDAQLTAFKEIFCEQVTGLIECEDSEKLVIEVQTFATFSAITFQELYDEEGEELAETVFSAGGAGEVVLVRVVYLWDVLTPLLSPILGGGVTGQRLLESSTIFKNEPF